MEMENSWVDFAVTRGPIRGRDRNRIGLIIRVKARREVEEFMSTLAQGRRLPVDANGDAWQNASAGGGSLEYYETDQRFENNRLYSLDSISGPPIISGNDGSQPVPRGGLRLPQEDVINLSFLRLAGVSDESGVVVGLAGAYSNDYLRRIKTMLPNAVKQFLQDYIVPVTINLHVISKG